MSPIALGLFAAVLQPAALERFEYRRPAMGTEFRIVLYASDSARAHRAATEALDRVTELDARLSDYDPESEISRLSGTAGTGEWVTPGADVWKVVSMAHEWSVVTGGAFDITVGPLTRLWRRADRRGLAVADEDRRAALEAVGWHRVELDPERQAVRLLEPGMRLDPGGIGKGYAVQEAMRVIRSHGLPSAMVDGGGDLWVGSPPPGAKGWRIGVPTLDQAGRPTVQERTVHDAVYATSGDRYRHTEVDGVRHSHILDPRTGRSVTTRRIVTVSAGPPAVADLLASAASVMTIDELKALRNLTGLQGTIRILEQDPGTLSWTEHIVVLIQGVQ